MRPLKINLLTPDPHEGTSFYRAWGPIHQIIRNRNVEVVEIRNMNWQSIAGTDIIIMHSPYTPMHIQAIKLAKAYGVKIWVDYDDDLINIPEWHYSYAKFQAASHIECIKEICRMADVVTTSTENIARSIKINAGQECNTVVIENYIPFDFPQYKNMVHAKKSPSDIIKVMWRGGRAHSFDVESYLPEIENAVSGYNVQFVCIGEPSALFKNHFPDNTMIMPIMELTEYFYYFATHPADIGIVPLNDNNAWNMGISNNAWREYLHGAMPSVYPHTFDIRTRNGYRNKAEFVQEFKNMLDMLQEPVEVYNLIERERAEMAQRRSDAIATRLSVFDTLAGRKKTATRILPHIFTSNK